MYCAGICAGNSQVESTEDVLLLHSDFYEGTGDRLKQYESVMLSLARGHKWRAVEFCNGISQWLEYVGRKEKATSRWERIRRDIADTKHIYRFISDLLISLARSPATSISVEPRVSEVWVDMPSMIARCLFAKYKDSLKVLYPHAESVFYSLRPPPPWTIEFKDSGSEERAPDTFMGSLRSRTQSLIHPAFVPTSTKFRFDKAYTFRGETYLADRVFDLDAGLTRERLQELFTFLPAEAQVYFNRIGRESGSRRRLSILFMMIPRKPEDFEQELAALIHVLKATAEIRGDDPVIVKPHPRSTDDYLMTVVRALRACFPQTEFRVVDQWSSVPGEIAASNWDISCCLGLYTSTLGVFSRRFNVPVFTPFKLVWEMYKGDPAWEACLINYLDADANWLNQV